jgi:aspartate oxidase
MIPRKWAFVGFDAASGTAPRIPQAASCYACHSSHAAADTTFVQFHPTLLPIATKLHTLSAAFVRENRALPLGGR